MAANNGSGLTIREKFYGLNHSASEDSDVSSAIAASLNNGFCEDSDLQKAILSSLDERNKIESESDLKVEEGKSGEDLCKETDVREIITKPKTLNSRIQEMHEMRSLELPLLYDSVGDTLVFIDPPSQQPEQDEESYERCAGRYQLPMRMKKEIFIKYGASYFEKLFDATNQYRILRRRGLVGKLPHNVKYVVDLTPPTEGDQAAYLMTELCCSEGVRKWYQASKRWMVSQTLIGGQDEYLLPWKARVQGLESDHSSTAQQSPLPVEYSPVRHRSAIERVLFALKGDDPHLNSAPKVWTTFAVAKYFGIKPDSPLKDYIVRWLRAFPNSNFLEVLPETALRIADGLQCPPLCRDTFAILVGEEALGAAYRSRVPDHDSTLSVHGRKKEPLPEDLKTAVEYASKALSDRVNTEFARLVGDGMHWIGDLAEFQKLSHFVTVPESLRQDLTKLIDLLKAYVRGAVYTVLCSDFPYSSDHMTGVPEDDLFPKTPWQEIWAKLIPCERILTRSFWSMLGCSDLLRGPTNLHVRLGFPDGSTMDTRGENQNYIRQELGFNEIFDKDVTSLVLSLKDRYFKYCSKLAEGRSSTREEKADIWATSPFLPLTDCSSDGTSFTAESEFDSTANLLSTDKDNDAVSETSLYPSTEVKNRSHCENEIHKRGSIVDDGILSSIFQAYKRQVYKNPAAFFDFDTFRSQVCVYLKTMGSRMTEAPDVSIRPEDLEVMLTRTLVCLTNSEWKYLPLWAGGNDDGSGGAFNDDVPFSYDGFSTAGPKVITGNQRGRGDNSTGSSFSVISDSGTSHPNTSLLNNNSFSDALPRGVAVSIDGESWASSSTFDSNDMIPRVPNANEADEDIQNVRVMLEGIQMNDSKADQDDETSVKSSEVDEAFDEIFAYSSDGDDDDEDEDEDEDDGDTINGDDLSEIDMSEDDP